MMRLIVILMMLAQLSGCAGLPAGQRATYSAVISKAKLNSENIDKLKVGMPQAQVLQIMGEPDRTEREKVDSRELKLLLYKIQETGLDLKEEDSSLVPVVLEGGMLIGWGENFYLHTVKSERAVKQETGFRKEEE